MEDLLPRLRSKLAVEPSTQCWVWTAAKDRRGYGRVRWSDRTMFSHRVIYEQCRGPIPEGLSLDHLCRNTSCANPEHLDPVDHAENVRRGQGAAVAKARYAEPGQH